MDAAVDFKAAIAAAGFEPPEIIEPGKLYRFSTNGKLSDDAGWCRMFEDEQGGVYGDHRTGISGVWQAKRERHFSASEIAEFKRKCEAERQARAEETRQRHESAAKVASELLANATADPATHPYSLKKRVALGPLVRRGAWPQRGWADALLVPIYGADGKIWSLEAIHPGGGKDFLKAAKKHGGFYPFGKVRGATRVLIGEGLATVAACAFLDSCPAVAAMDALNLIPVAKAVRELAPDAEIIILADDDPKPDGTNPGMTAAREAAKEVCGKVAVPSMDKKADFWDLWNERGPEAVKSALQEAGERLNPNPGEKLSGAEKSIKDGEEETEEQIIQRLAAISSLEYAKARKEAAKSLGIPVGTLDKLVKDARRETEISVEIEDIEPWSEAVDPAELLSAITKTVSRFIVCQGETARAVALWVTMTWFMDSIQVAPLAVITAPEKRCGKSMLLSLLAKLSRRPLMASNISPAALFRSIDAWQPTLLVDEADAFMRDNEELRGLLNCGHTRDSAYVVRTVGDDHTPRKFKVWGAKAIAGIGKLADTLMDRAVILELRRKLPHEQVERFRYAEPGLFEELAAKLARLSKDCQEAIRQSRPELPASLNDRAQDNWEPLLAIADVAGGSWPEWARSAALKLSGADSPSMTVGTELLHDIQEVFELKKTDRISTADLIEELCSDDERPWLTYNRGKQISPRQIATRLKEYGIRSKTIRVGLETPKGFELSQFEEAFARYLSPQASPENCRHTPQASNGAGSSVADKESVAATQSQSATRKASNGAGCGVVADKSPWDWSEEI